MLSALVGAGISQTLHFVDQGLTKFLKLHNPCLLVGNDVIQFEHRLFLVCELEFDLCQSVVGHCVFPWLSRSLTGDTSQVKIVDQP